MGVGEEDNNSGKNKTVKQAYKGVEVGEEGENSGKKMEGWILLFLLHPSVFFA